MHLQRYERKHIFEQRKTSKLDYCFLIPPATETDSKLPQKKLDYFCTKSFLLLHNSIV